MSDAVETTPRFKVGDELAFSVWWPWLPTNSQRWRIMRIARITPSGVLVCGAGSGATKVRAKGDRLVVIGDSSCAVEPVTDEIRRHIRFHEMIGTIKATCLEGRDYETVEQVYRILCDRKSKEGDR
jgi:hypothetical protein